MKVLCIDDHEDSLTLYGLFLEEVGHEVKLCDTIEEGMLEMETGGYDHVLIDWFLPRLDGKQFLSKLPKTTRLTVVTGLEAHTELVRVSRLDGVCHVLVKPIDYSELIERLGSCPMDCDNCPHHKDIKGD